METNSSLSHNPELFQIFQSQFSPGMRSQKIVEAQSVIVEFGCHGKS